MAKPVELVPFVCLQCGRTLPVNPNESAWVCSNCQHGMYLDEQAGLASMQIFFQAGIDPNRPGKPFWVAQGRVQVERKTYSGNNAKDAERFWAQPHSFFVPAYNLPLENLLDIGSKLIRKPPSLQGGPVVQFEPPVLLRSDVPAVAEFIVMAVEADRRDKLKEVNLTLQLSEPVLWILP